MPLRGSSAYYSDVSWFVRAVRALPVIAGAALLGGLIGGFAVFAVDSALNWEPASQVRPEARADDQTGAQTGAPATAQTGAQPSAEAIAVEQRVTKSVRVVGGAVPDPSAGISRPPPQQQPQSPQQRSSTPVQPQISSQPISSQLLAPKPLGPATRLQPLNTTTAPQEQPTHWPDALSRAPQNASNAQEQSASPRTPQSTGANINGEAGRKAADSDRATSADNQDRSSSARYGRHSRQKTFGANGWRNGDDFSTTPSSRRQDARSYDRDRLYDSYSNRRNRSYGSRREPSYGDVAPQPGPGPYGGYFGRGPGYYSDDY